MANTPGMGVVTASGKGGLGPSGTGRVFNSDGECPSCCQDVDCQGTPGETSYTDSFGSIDPGWCIYLGTPAINTGRLEYAYEAPIHNAMSRQLRMIATHTGGVDFSLNCQKAGTERMKGGMFITESRNNATCGDLSNPVFQMFWDSAGFGRINITYLDGVIQTGTQIGFQEGDFRLLYNRISQTTKRYRAYVNGTLEWDITSTGATKLDGCGPFYYGFLVGPYIASIESMDPIHDGKKFGSFDDVSMSVF